MQTPFSVEEPIMSLTTFSFWDVTSGKQVKLPQPSIDVVLKPNRSSELCEFETPAHANTVVATDLVDGNGAQLARRVSRPEPLKFLTFCKDPKLRIQRKDDSILVSAAAPLKGLVLSVDPNKPEARWEDNCFGLVPNETVSVGVKD